ncbi:MAG TPA: hypothetical protein VFA22_07170 [Stellaceae bacterium]|nr:hypothetical protein [Stellaceae bacterium]
MRVMLATMILMAVAGCASDGERAARFCRDAGITADNPAYANCVMNYQTARELRRGSAAIGLGLLHP